jgi:hypothetical protein
MKTQVKSEIVEVISKKIVQIYEYLDGKPFGQMEWYVLMDSYDIHFHQDLDKLDFGQLMNLSNEIDNFNAWHYNTLMTFYSR